VAKVDTSKMSMRDRQTLEKRLLIEALDVTVQAFTDLVGSEEIVELMRPYLRNSGAAFTANMTEMFKIEGDDLERIAEISHLAEEFFNLDGQEIVRDSEKIVRMGNPECPHRYGPKEMCLLVHEVFLSAVCQGIDHEYQCKIVQMIPNGDPYCSVVIQKKKK
jgi:hypothetical protein